MLRGGDIGCKPIVYLFSLSPLTLSLHRYLPPPVLEVLNDKQIEATKRAALLTSALTWFLANIPTAVLPLPLQPIILLLQALVPYVSYLGSAITWGWDTIKDYDVGE